MKTIPRKLCIIISSSINIVDFPFKLNHLETKTETTVNCFHVIHSEEISWERNFQTLHSGQSVGVEKPLKSRMFAFVLTDKKLQVDEISVDNHPQANLKFAG